VKVLARVTATMTRAARYFPATSSDSVSGRVASSSIEPVRRSSAKRRMVTAGTSRSRNSPDQKKRPRRLTVAATNTSSNHSVNPPTSTT